MVPLKDLVGFHVVAAAVCVFVLGQVHVHVLVLVLSVIGSVSIAFLVLLFGVGSCFVVGDIVGIGSASIAFLVLLLVEFCFVVYIVRNLNDVLLLVFEAGLLAGRKDGFVQTILCQLY